MMCLSFLVVVYSYIVNVTYREFIAVHYTYVLIAFLIFADFSEVPIEKRLLYANRHSPLTLGLHAAVISPAPATHSRRPDQTEKAQKQPPRNGTGAAFTYSILIFQSRFETAAGATEE